MAKELDFDDYRIQNLRYPIATVTGSYTASLEDYVIISTGSSLTLPQASAHRGKMYIVKSTNQDISVGVLLPIPDASVLTVSNNTCKHIISNGSTWVDISPG